MKSVGVMCGGNLGNNPAYHHAAYRLGATLAERGLELVFGGAQEGMMSIVADATLSHGGSVRGVINSSLISLGMSPIRATTLEEVRTVHQRRTKMAVRADAFVALPGGFGTLSDLFVILTWAQLGLHRKPCALLNTEGYFDGLLDFLYRAEGENFLYPENRAMLFAESDPEVLVERFRTFTPPAVEM
jgi:uncharacterized protein (TIGR00730 family)